MKKKFNKTFIYLVGAARKIWRWSPERREVKKNAQRTKVLYECSACRKQVKKIEVDHVHPVGIAPRTWEGWDSYYLRLFCPKENLTALCVPCHQTKTAKERKELSYVRKLRKTVE